MTSKKHTSTFYCFLICFCCILYCSLSNRASAQIVNDDSTFVHESSSDSLDIMLKYFDISDSLSSFFEFDSLYPKWNNDNLYYQKYDFSKKKDTTLIFLQDNKGHYYKHPYCGIETSPFGWRRYQFHTGIDIGLRTGDTVRCAFDGIVRITKWNSGYGNVVVVRHNNGLETLYGHLSKSLVYANQTIKAGDVIGLGGNTGHSRGSHLHFEVRYLGTPLNPATIIDFKKHCLLSDTLFLSAKSFQYYNTVKTYQTTKYGTRYYAVRKGDTLSKIAKQNGTTVKALCTLNGISTKTILKIGRKLRVR